MSSTDRDVINAAGGIQGESRILTLLDYKWRDLFYLLRKAAVPITFKFMHPVASRIMLRLIWEL